jgi:hypothetical protein
MVAQDPSGIINSETPMDFSGASLTSILLGDDFEGQ